MNVSAAIRTRKSVRKFLDREVERNVIESILDTARWAASGTNAQPWEVVVLTGRRKRELCRQIEAAFFRGDTRKMDYRYYPENWKEPFRTRRIRCGLALYSALSIERDDIERRKLQWAANYRAFDAPVMLLFFIDQAMETGSYLDYGMFLQSIMLSALDNGLATCPQAALGEFPDLVRNYTGYDADHALVCGMALGYEDRDDPVNRYRTAREDIREFVRFLDDQD